MFEFVGTPPSPNNFGPSFEQRALIELDSEKNLEGLKENIF